MKQSIFFVTGTNTGVGKSVLASLLIQHLQAANEPAVALKPICSGGREDARLLRRASNNLLTLDETNPWHFRAPLTPLLAARREKRRLQIGQVLEQARKIQRRFPILVIESAGGLLSPLGESFDARDLIVRLRAIPIVAALNQLGVINQVRLVLTALPSRLASRAQVVLVSPSRPDLSSKSNVALLRELYGRERIHALPWLKGPASSERGVVDREICQTMGRLIKSGKR